MLINFNLKENIVRLGEAISTKVHERKEPATKIANKLNGACKSISSAFSLMKRTASKAVKSAYASIAQSIENKKGPTVGDICKEMNISKQEWEAFPIDLEMLLVNLKLEKEVDITELGNPLGEGSCGSVYSVGEKFVIKVSKGDVSNDEGDPDKNGNDLVMGRIKGRDCSGLYVKNVDFITKYYGSTTGNFKSTDNEKATTRYISIFERADGVDGEKFLSSEVGKNLSFSQRLSIADQWAKGIASLHSVGLVHQDIKPENVQVYCHENDIRVKLIDFQTVNTQTEKGACTPLFTTNEEICGLKKDVYAFGCSMLFNFFPDKAKEVEAFLSVKNQCFQISVSGLENIKLLPGLEDIKSLLDGDNNLRKIMNKKNNQEEYYLYSKSNLLSQIQVTKKMIDNLVDLLNENSTSNEGKPYDAKTIAFLKEFFNQTIISKNPPSMEQVSRAFNAFNDGILDSGKISGIFDMAANRKPKHIPEYLFQEIKNAEKDQSLEAEQKLEKAKEELSTFVGQNPDMISTEDKKKLQQLGIGNVETEKPSV